MRYSIEIRKFLYSQYFFGGLRIAFGVSLPAVLMLIVFHNRELGFTIATGALGACVVDMPGPLKYKHNEMLACTVIGFLSRARYRHRHGRHVLTLWLHRRAAHVRAVADRRVRQPLAADQLRHAVHDDRDAGRAFHADAGARQRVVDSAGRPLVHVLGDARQPLDGVPHRTAGARRKHVRLRRVSAGARGFLRSRQPISTSAIAS